MSRSVVIGLLLATIVALALRCPALRQRPMHNDEAVNAVKFRSLWEQGSYRFDPNEHHGPTLQYLTLLWVKLCRVPNFADLSEAQLRGLIVCFGTGLILLLVLVADGLGRSAVICSAMLTAVSPAMVFYSRYYIHEMLLAFFTFLALALGWRYFRSRKLVWAVLTGVAVGLMQTTKETFILAGFAVTVALGLNRLWAGELAKDHSPAGVNLKHIAVAIGAWVVVAVVLFSSFFSNASGPLDALRAYSPWLNRAGGNSPHIHPWYFYLERLTFYHVERGPIWSEGLILVLAVVGFFVSITGRGAPHSHKGFLRVLALYTLTLTVTYGLIPYKTPWCLLGFWDGAILLAGVGAVALFNWPSRNWMKSIVALLLFCGAAQLALQAWRASVTYAADRRNPYVYSQTSPNLLALVDQVEALARVHPNGNQMTIKIMAPGSDYWPLPWYLRVFGQTGWWTEVTDNPIAPVMIVSAKFQAGLDEDKSHIMTSMYELRPDAFLELYVEKDLWQAYLNSKAQSDVAK